MKGTKITIGDRKRTLRYDLNAISEIGDRLGMKIRISHIQEDLLDHPMPLSAIRTLIWAGLIHEDEELTEKEVGAGVDMDNLPDVLRDFFEAFGATWRGSATEKTLETIGGRVGAEAGTPTV